MEFLRRQRESWDVTRDKRLIDFSRVTTLSFNAASTALPARIGASSSVISSSETLLKCWKFEIYRLCRNFLLSFHTCECRVEDRFIVFIIIINHYLLLLLLLSLLLLLYLAPSVVKIRRVKTRYKNSLERLLVVAWLFGERSPKRFFSLMRWIIIIIKIIMILLLLLWVVVVVLSYIITTTTIAQSCRPQSSSAAAAFGRLRPRPPPPSAAAAPGRRRPRRPPSPAAANLDRRRPRPQPLSSLSSLSLLLLLFI